MDQNGLPELRAEYFQQVIAALGEYCERGHELALSSSRDGDAVTVVFKLSAGEEYQGLLEHLTSSGLGGPDTAS